MIITLKAVHLCLDISNKTSTVVWSFVESAHNNAPVMIFPTKIYKYPGSVIDGVKFTIASLFRKRLFFGPGARTSNHLGRLLTSCLGLIRTGHRNKNSRLLCFHARTCILVVVLRTMIPLIGWCKKDVTQLRSQWSYAFLAINRRHKTRVLVIALPCWNRPIYRRIAYY